MRVVLVIGVVLAVLQQVTGINVFLYFGRRSSRQMGAERTRPCCRPIVVGAVNLLFTIVAIWTVDRLGRKPLMIVGAAGMGVCLLAMGLAAAVRATPAVGAGLHPRLHRLLRPVRRAGDLGDPLRDLPHAIRGRAHGASPRSACGWPTSSSRRRSP